MNMNVAPEKLLQQIKQKKKLLLMLLVHLKKGAVTVKAFVTI